MLSISLKFSHFISISVTFCITVALTPCLGVNGLIFDLIREDDKSTLKRLLYGLIMAIKKPQEESKACFKSEGISSSEPLYQNQDNWATGDRLTSRKGIHVRARKAL